MRKLLLGLAFALPMALAVPAAALPGSVNSGLPTTDVIQVKGGHGGHGSGHHMGRGGGHRAFGWSRGRKVGWGGYGCPPGLRRQGRC
jgi:hypothetical protein